LQVPLAQRALRRPRATRVLSLTAPVAVSSMAQEVARPASWWMPVESQALRWPAWGVPQRVARGPVVWTVARLNGHPGPQQTAVSFRRLVVSAQELAPRARESLAATRPSQMAAPVAA
jgi:hypothetical protein